ncbi:MAG TPA: tRNA (adenosine(37)-N6)-threonylcarbamoyltransferase complex ATPase subunit type 1 TsaE [Acidimicrobiales bacterium]|nr:tRNA (adenosine(37)-N6)-threonylcarbamoyltransferase complex ATPase subunit type 1 TsaE [Acidimicrobiales bacterium]
MTDPAPDCGVTDPAPDWGVTDPAPDGGWPVVAGTEGPEGTRALAGALADLARSGDVILLVGGLGAGKTTFAQGFARRLGVVGPVTSPTFTLVRQYPCSLGQLLHADVYRLERLAEVADLGLGELVEGGSAGDGAVALVEWGDAAAPVFGPQALTVSLAPVPAPVPAPGGAAGEAPEEMADGIGDEARLIRIDGGGVAWAGRRRAVADALARWTGDR